MDTSFEDLVATDPYHRPLRYLREGRLLRGAWTGEADEADEAAEAAWDRMTVDLIEVIEEVRDASA